MRLLLAHDPDDQRARPGRELLHERGAERLGTGDVVRAVEDHERLPPHQFEAPR